MALMAILTRLDMGSLSGAEQHAGDGWEAIVHYMLLWKLQTFNERKRPANRRTESSSHKSHSDLHITTQGCVWSMDVI